MSNAYISRFTSIHHRAATPFTQTKTRRVGTLLSFSSSASLLVSPIAHHIIRSPSEFVLRACLSPSDAPQRSEEWFALRQDKLTTSTFSTALGFWKGTRRSELWNEKVFATEAETLDVGKKSAMQWGVLNESTAIEKYKSITGRDVDSLGFATHSEEKFNWIGASPDGLLGFFPGGGILEVKCPFNKGKPELGLPWTTMPFYYMPQVQGLMEVLDRDWADLYCWTPNASTIFRVNRDRSYWLLIHEILREFWWENVIPAREALLMGNEKAAESFKPESTHNKTGLAIVKSIHLAKESKLHCREVADHVEFFSKTIQEFGYLSMEKLPKNYIVLLSKSPSQSGSKWFNYGLKSQIRAFLEKERR